MSEIRNFSKVKWEGIKGLCQTFILHLWTPWIQILFKYKTLERRWHDFFHLNQIKRVVENIRISFENISSSETLSNSMIFMSEDKMTSSKYMKYELEVSKKPNLTPLWNHFQFGVILVFIQIFFSKNKIYIKNRVKWFPTVEKWREINLKSFLYFKMIFIGFYCSSSTLCFI